MIETLDVVTHWPFVRSHLLIDKKPAVGRVLETLAERQFLAGGPVTMSGSALAKYRFSPGEAGHANDVLRWLMQRGVVGRYEGAGRRPALWHFSPALQRWRLPWRWSSADVERSISLCSCRGGPAAAARLPGSENRLPRGDEIFYLAEDVHLHLYRASRASTGDDRAAVAPGSVLTRDDSRPARDKDRAYTSPLGKERDFVPLEGMGRLQEVIRKETGGRAFGAPEQDLIEALQIVGPEGAEELAEELALEIVGLKAPPVAASRAKRLAPDVAARVHRRRQQAEDADRKRWAWIQSVGVEHDPDFAEEVWALKGRLGSLDLDA